MPPTRHRRARPKARGAARADLASLRPAPAPRLDAGYRNEGEEDGDLDPTFLLYDRTLSWAEIKAQRSQAADVWHAMTLAMTSAERLMDRLRLAFAFLNDHAPAIVRPSATIAIEALALDLFAGRKLTASETLKPAVVFGPAGFRAYLPLMSFVVAGPNRLAATWRIAGEPTIGARVALFDDGAEFFTGAGRDLARLDTVAAGGTGADFAGPAGAPAGWAWHGCRRRTDAAAAVAAAHPFVEALATAFRSGGAA